MEHLFGEIKNGEMILNDAGKMIEEQWKKLPERFPNLELHEFTVMPNHFHGIIEIIDPLPLVRAALVAAPTPDQSIPSTPDQPMTLPPNKKIALPFDKNIAQSSDFNVDLPDEDTKVAPMRGARTSAENAGQQDLDNAPVKSTVGEMMGAFKSITTLEYINGVKSLGWKPFNRKLWKRDYWEHIIRHSKAYDKISDYIFNNALHWQQDKFYRK